MDGYAVNLPAELVKYTGEPSDPAMKALREYAVEQKWSQGQFDDTLGVIKAFADKGVLHEMFDPAAEAAKLGDNAPARRQEVEVFAKSLLERKEIDDAEFGELMSLAPTAAGVTLMEKLRKMMGPGAGVTAPRAGDGPQESPEMAEAKAMRLDPKYDTDSRFKRAADAAWIKAFQAGKGA